MKSEGSPQKKTLGRESKIFLSFFFLLLRTLRDFRKPYVAVPYWQLCPNSTTALILTRFLRTCWKNSVFLLLGRSDARCVTSYLTLTLVFGYYLEYCDDAIWHTYRRARDPGPSKDVPADRGPSQSFWLKTSAEPAHRGFRGLHGFELLEIGMSSWDILLYDSSHEL